MYYILYEGLQIESNEPVYCTVYNVLCTLYIYAFENNYYFSKIFNK